MDLEFVMILSTTSGNKVSIEAIPLNRANDEQVVERSGIFTVLK